MSRRSLAVAALLPLLAVACGVPVDSEPRPIPDDRVPFGLLDPEPTSTTSPAADGTPGSTGTASATVFLVAGDRLTPVSRMVPSPATPGKALEALLAGATPEEAARGVRTVIAARPAGASATVAGGLARVELASPLPTSSREQVLAIAQIVFTLTTFPGLEAVSFTLSGRPVEVPAGNGTLTSGALRRSDFVSVAPL